MLMIIGTLFSFQFTICSYVLKYLRNLPKKCVLLNIGISLRKMDNIFFTIIIYLKDIHRGTWGTPKARYSLKLYKTKGHVLPVFNSFLPQITLHQIITQQGSYARFVCQYVVVTSETFLPHRSFYLLVIYPPTAIKVRPFSIKKLYQNWRNSLGEFDEPITVD